MTIFFQTIGSRESADAAADYGYLQRCYAHKTECCASRSLHHEANVLIQGLNVLRQGTTVNDSPPAFKNISRPAMAISSSVSRQSATKAGQTTTRSLIPLAGNDPSNSTVNGLIHSSRPRRD